MRLLKVGGAYVNVENIYMNNKRFASRIQRKRWTSSDWTPSLWSCFFFLLSGREIVINLLSIWSEFWNRVAMNTLYMRLGSLAIRGTEGLLMRAFTAVVVISLNHFPWPVPLGICELPEPKLSRYYYNDYLSTANHIRFSLISLDTIDVSHQMRRMVRPDHKISAWWNRAGRRLADGLITVMCI